MGIDMFMSATPAPTDQHGRVRYPLRRTERSTMHRRVDALSDRIVMACAETIGVDLEEPDPAAWIRSFLHEAVDAVLVKAPPWCAILQVARPWLVAGGTSCGDMPNDYDHVAALGASGITEAPLGASDVCGTPMLAASIHSEVSSLMEEHVDALLRAARTSPAQRQRVMDATRKAMIADIDSALEAIALSIWSNSSEETISLAFFTAGPS